MGRSKLTYESLRFNQTRERVVEGEGKDQPTHLRGSTSFKGCSGKIAKMKSHYS